MSQQIPMYYPDGFVLDTALTCAKLVETAYDQYAQWAAQDYPYMDDFIWSKDSVYEYSAPFYWSYDEGFYQEPIGFLAVRDKVGYLTFRGTQGHEDELYDLMMDQTAYALVENFGQVHNGFFQIYSQVSPQVKTALQTQGMANGQTTLTRLVFTGHSLGSALSSLAVPDVVANAGLSSSLPMIHLNLASPRVGDPTFAAAMNSGGVPTFRVVNTEDIVPDGPLAVQYYDTSYYYYKHFGTPVDFTANYRSIELNHSLTNTYTYALSYPSAPQNPEAVMHDLPGATRSADARVSLAAKIAAAQAVAMAAVKPAQRKRPVE